MNSQQLYNSGKQNRNKKIERRYNFSSLSRYRQQQSSQQEMQQQFSFQSPMPIKLVHYKPHSRSLPEQSYSKDIKFNNHSKVKQQYAYLPNIQKREEKMKSLSHSIQPQTHKLAKKRLKTESIQPQNSEYTIIEIKEIKDMYKKDNRIKGQKIGHSFKQRKLGRKEKIHERKQQEFQQYVHQFEQKYQTKQSQIKISPEVQIQERLRNRVQTKKYTYSKPLNPELNSNEKGTKKNNSLITQGTTQQLKDDIENREQQAQKQEDDETRMRRLRQMNEDFIKILRKAKNRGASLLAKLNMFPSKQLILK